MTIGGAASVLVADARRGHRGLFGFAVLMAALSVALMAAAILDNRVLLGAEVWLKPLKFSLSFSLYAGAMAWILGQFREPMLRRTGWVIVATSSIEMFIIAMQAGRGVRSHYNDDSVFDETLFEFMGLTIIVLWVATLFIAVRFLREPGANRTLATAIRLGLAISLFGMAIGVVMIAHNAHTVGAADGGAGLPLLGWSTSHGDIRASHFVGLHALQLLPLLAALLSTTTLQEDRRTRVVRVVAAGYAALVAVLLWQALRGQALVEPDGLTLAALAVIGVGTVAGVLVVVRGRAASRLVT